MKHLAAIVWLVMLLAGVAHAQTPGNFSFQGPLTVPGLPRITPQAVDQALNAAFGFKLDVTGGIASGLTADGLAIVGSGTFNGANLLPSVASNAELQALLPTAGAFSTVYRQGYTAANDGGAAMYAYTSSPCTLNVGAGDGGSQIKPANALGCWNALFGPSVSVRAFGARGDGVTDDSPAFQAAINYQASRRGGEVTVPPSGAAYLLNEGITVGNGLGTSNVTLRGVAGLYWPGPYDNIESDWTPYGTWLHCKDQANSCITLSGNGGALDTLSFWYTQPTPPGTPCGETCVMQHNWTPTPYPFTITVAPPQNFNRISNINVVNGTQCIDIEGGNTGVATIYTYLEHLKLSCFNTAIKFRQVDNTVTLNDYRDQIWWYPFNPNLIGYTEGDASSPGHKVGWDMGYLANLQATNVEFYEDWTGIQATDGTVQSGLGTVVIGGQALQLTNISFNQDCQAVGLASSTTHFSAHFSNVIVATDPQTSSIATQCGMAFPYAFNLNSDNADVTLSNFDGYKLQSIAQVGGGSGGVLHVNGNLRGTYSAFATGASAFTVNTGAALDLPSGTQGLIAGASAGPIILGSVNYNLVTPNPIVTPGLNVSGSGAVGVQVQGPHSAEAVADNSTAPVAVNLGGTYSVAAVVTSNATTAGALQAKAGQNVCFNGGGSCVVYNSASGKLYISSSTGTTIASFDNSGNAIFKGTVTQNGTP